MYATLQDLLARYPERDLAQITDPSGMAVDEVRVAEALSGAAAVIDGYLQARYPLPLAQVPELLREYTCDIAMYRLQALRPADDVQDARNRYKDAIRFLEQAAKGDLQLGLSADQQPAVHDGGPLVIAPDRHFTRGSMRGFHAAAVRRSAGPGWGALAGTGAEHPGKAHHAGAQRPAPRRREHPPREGPALRLAHLQGEAAGSEGRDEQGVCGDPSVRRGRRHGAGPRRRPRPSVPGREPGRRHGDRADPALSPGGQLMPPQTILGNTPTRIQDLEAGMVARLREKVASVEVTAHPDKPDSYRLLHQVGALLVSYRGSVYSEPESEDEVIQERELHFDVDVLARGLSGHAGSYVFLEAVRDALAGHQVPGFRKLRPIRERFLGYGEGVWIFAVTFAAFTVAAEMEEGEA
jgi:phage gp36-like protein